MKREAVERLSKCTVSHESQGLKSKEFPSHDVEPCAKAQANERLQSGVDHRMQRNEGSDCEHVRGNVQLELS